METNAPTDGRICTECGWNTPNYRPVRLPWWHHRRYAPLLIALTAVGVMAMFTGSYTFSSGTPSPQFVLPGFTRGEVRAIAEGTSERTGLGEAMVKRVSSVQDIFGGPIRVRAGFGKAEAPRSSSVSIGWPTSWMSDSRDTFYDDAVSRIGPRPAAIDPNLPPQGPYGASSTPALPPRDEWDVVGLAVLHRPPPHSVGGDDVSRWYKPAALVGTLGVFILIASLVWLTLAVCGYFAGRRLSRRWRWACVLLTPLVLVGWMCVTSVRRNESVPSYMMSRQVAQGVYYFTYDTLASIGLDKDRLTTLSKDPGGDRAIAKAIIDAVAPGDDSEWLQVWGVSTVFIQKGQATMYPGWLGAVTVATFDYTLSPEEGPVNIVQPAWNWRWIAGKERQEVAWVGGEGKITRISVDLQSIGVVVVGFAIVASVDWWLFGPLVSWRGRRARRRGLCPQCRYPLTAPGSSKPL